MDERPVIVLVNDPVPVPSVVLVDRDTVGPVVVAHTTPRAVTALPPSEVMLPPELAVVVVTDVTGVVASEGKSTMVRFKVVAEEPW